MLKLKPASTIELPDWDVHHECDQVLETRTTLEHLSNQNLLATKS